MNKQEFLSQLRKGLSSLPQKEIEERVNFYGEMIDDRTEEGFSEEEAVLQIGSPEDIIGQIIAEFPIAKLVKERITPKRKLSVLEIVLLILGSPIWLSLLIALFAIIFSLYVVLWSVVISLWSAFATLLGGALGGILSTVGFILSGNHFSAVAMLSAGIVLSGISIFFFFGCKGATKGILLLTKKIAIGIKNCFIKKEEA